MPRQSLSALLHGWGVGTQGLVSACMNTLLSMQNAAQFCNKLTKTLLKAAIHVETENMIQNRTPWDCCWNLKMNK